MRRRQVLNLTTIAALSAAVLVIAFYTAPAARAADELAIGAQGTGFNLKGTDGRMHSLDNVKGTKGTAVIFTCNECPFFSIEAMGTSCKYTLFPSSSAVSSFFFASSMGRSTATKNAGIPYPKIYSWSLGAQGIAGLRNGQRTAGVPQDYAMQGWQTADTLARYFTGKSLAPDNLWGGFVIWSNDYHNLPTVSAGVAPPTIKTYQQQFKKLWGK